MQIQDHAHDPHEHEAKRPKPQPPERTPDRLETEAQTTVDLAASFQRSMRSSSPSMSPIDILSLQQAMGNRAVQRLLKTRQRANSSPGSAIQSKLTVNPPDDQYEKEADHVAEQVVQRIEAPQTASVQCQAEEEEEVQTKPVASIQRQAEEEEEVQTKPVASVQRQAEEEEEVQTKPVASVQRQAEEEEEVQTKRSEAGGFDVSGGLENRLADRKGSGSPLPEGLRSQMEAGFGADFSGVRLHTDGEANQMNCQLSSRAFTHGQNVYFGTGQYDTESSSGKALIAHELTHTIQQTGAQPRSKALQRVPALTREQEAEAWVNKEKAKFTKWYGGQGVACREYFRQAELITYIEKWKDAAQKDFKESSSFSWGAKKLLGGLAGWGPHKWTNRLKKLQKLWASVDNARKWVDGRERDFTKWAKGSQWIGYFTEATDKEKLKPEHREFIGKWRSSVSEELMRMVPAWDTDTKATQAEVNRKKDSLKPVYKGLKRLKEAEYKAKRFGLAVPGPTGLPSEEKKSGLEKGESVAKGGSDITTAFLEVIGAPAGGVAENWGVVTEGSDKSKLNEAGGGLNITGGVLGLIGLAASLPAGILSLITGAKKWKAGGDSKFEGITQVLETIGGGVVGLGKVAGSVTQIVGGAIKSKGTSAASGIISDAFDALGGLVSMIGGIVQAIHSGINSSRKEMWKHIEGAVRSGVDMIAGGAKMVFSILGSIPATEVLGPVGQIIAATWSMIKGVWNFAKFIYRIIRQSKLVKELTARGSQPSGPEQKKTVGYLIDTSKKRIKRAGLSILVNAINFGGDLIKLGGGIAKFFGPQGAIAGLVLDIVGTLVKFVGTGIEKGAAVARWTKQTFRDQAAAGKGFLYKVGKALGGEANLEKTTAKKHEQRVGVVKGILTDAANAANIPNPSGMKLAELKKKEEEFKLVELEVDATGVDTKKLRSLNGKTPDQAKLVYDALKERE